MFRLDGKRALITGGGTGIGFAIADVFAKQGAKVAVSGRRPDVLKRAVAKLEAAHGRGCAIYVQGDVSQVDSARAMVAECIARLGGIELLVNSAGSVDRVTSLESTIEGWDAIFNLNVRGTFITCQEAIRWMVAHGGGSIVNISSTASEKAYSPAASYGPSKAAVNNMSYNMAVEYGPQQVLESLTCLQHPLSPTVDHNCNDLMCCRIRFESTRSFQHSLRPNLRTLGSSRGKIGMKITRNPPSLDVSGSAPHCCSLHAKVGNGSCALDRHCVQSCRPAG